MFIPVAPPLVGQAVVVTSVPPNTATNFESVAGGAFIPTATQPGQTLVSGVAPDYAWVAEDPSLVAVTTFNGRDGDVTLTSTDVTGALGFNPYDRDNPSNYQNDTQVAAMIAAAVPAPSSSLPLMDGSAAPGSGALWSRYDHVHPTDTSRYAASNPAGYQTAAQVLAVLPAVPASSSTNPVMDGVAAPGASGAWSRGDHVHPTDTSRYAVSNPAGYQTSAQVLALLPAYTLNPAMDGAASAGSSSSWSRGDHVHPVDTSRYAASNPAGYQTQQQVLDAIASVGGGASPSNTNPIMDGVAAPGTATPYARGDHVHPSDTSRAPIANPVFTGTVTLAQDPTQPLQAVTMQFVNNYTLDCGTF
jgi:hypothetical protein